MAQDAPLTPREKLDLALSRMESALELLDEADAPGEIGAYLDMAIVRLKEALQEATVDLDRIVNSAHRRQE